MSKGNKRRDFLKRLVGKEDTEELKATLQAVQQALTTLGVKRKEVDRKTTKGLLEDMSDQVDQLLSSVTDDPALKTDLRNNLIATIMGVLGSVDPGDVEESVPEGETMQEDEDEEELMAARELANQIKAMVADNQTLAEDVSALAELVPSFVGMAKSVKQLVPLVEKAATIEALEQRIADAEEKLAMRPRRASQDDATKTKDDVLKESIEKGTEEHKTELGIRVKA